MLLEINHTHEAKARSWVESANRSGSDFPIQNLPYAVFRRRQSADVWRGGIAIGDEVVDLAALSQKGLLEGLAATATAACAQSTLNAFFDMGPSAWQALRHGLFRHLSLDANAEQQRAIAECLVPQNGVEYAVPVQIGDYSDYYTSVYHAVNIGRLAGLDTATPNFKWIPLGYHGRASSIGVSGQKFHRPLGQTKAPDVPTPILQPTKKLDYELELAIYIGKSNQQGQPVSLSDAEQHIFGIGLLNDWSARDIQFWEMAPLGPFLGKSFATTISLWIVSLEALTPFRLPFERPANDPQPLPYLDAKTNRAAGAIDITLEVWLGSSKQRAQGLPSSRVSSTSFKHQYWTVAQMLAHHTINGCNLKVGDVIGSGTVSGPTVTEAGALIELALNGAAPVELATSEKRSFLEDGDTVALRGYCEKPGFARIGFGECWGEVVPSISSGAAGAL
jgi:fumarylacetoacetase